MLKPVNIMRQKRIRRIADALKQLNIGDQLTHSEIAEAAGMTTVPNELFQCAHRLANLESGCYVDSVRSIGYIRRPPSDWDAVAGKYRARSRKQASTGRKFITNIVAKTNDLSNTEQLRASREIGLLQTIEALTRRIERGP